MSLLVLHEDVLGSGVLLVHHLQHFLVDLSGSCFRVGALETIFVLIIVADVGQRLAHTQISHHAIGTLRGALQVVHGSGRDVPGEQFLGGSSTHQRAHLVEHLLLGGNLSLLGEIPGGTQCLSARHDGYLDKRVGVLAEPRDGGMTGLMEGDASLLVGSHHLGLLFQSTHDAVYGIEEVLLANSLLVVAGGDEGSLVAYVGDVGSRESRCLAGQEVDVYGLVHLDRFEMYLEDGLAFVQARQVYVYLTVETAGTEQGTVEHVHTVGGG